MSLFLIFTLCAMGRSGATLSHSRTVIPKYRPGEHQFGGPIKSELPIKTNTQERGHAEFPKQKNVLNGFISNPALSEIWAVPENRTADGRTFGKCSVGIKRKVQSKLQERMSNRANRPGIDSHLGKESNRCLTLSVSIEGFCTTICAPPQSGLHRESSQGIFQARYSMARHGQGIFPQTHSCYPKYKYRQEQRRPIHA